MLNIKRYHPGVYIKESLDSMEMTAKEFAIRTGISERTLSSIINGNGSVTFDVAYKLASYFDTSVDLWSNLQNAYDLYCKETEIAEQMNNDWQLAKTIKKYLVEHKLVDKGDSKEAVVNKARKLAGVNALELLKTPDSFVCLKQQHSSNGNEVFAQNFWISLALNEARKKNGVNYDRDKLLLAIETLRKMTVREPHDFYPDLEDTLSQCGISFVVLPYLSKTNIYGATKWFSRSNVMMAVSNRTGKADLFWFTLFHEIAHVLMEHRREMLVNEVGIEDTEADKMAADLLIPAEQWEQFISTNVFTPAAIFAFAEQVGIHPCLVLGRLHKGNIVPYGKFEKEFGKTYYISEMI